MIIIIISLALIRSISLPLVFRSLFFSSFFFQIFLMLETRKKNLYTCTFALKPSFPSHRETEGEKKYTYRILVQMFECQHSVCVLCFFHCCCWCCICVCLRIWCCTSISFVCVFFSLFLFGAVCTDSSFLYYTCGNKKKKRKIICIYINTDPQCHE